jgi:hypothetical protein
LEIRAALALGLTVVVAATAAAPAASEPQSAAVNFDFLADLLVISTSAPCPADVPPNTTECRALSVAGALSVRDAISSFVGPWQVSESTYTSPLGLGPPTCPAGLGKPLATAGRLVVTGGEDFALGEIAFGLSDGARCVGYESVRQEPQEFTITGGTGRFAGASGSGKLVRYWDDPDWGDGEAWTGTLTAPGFDFTVPKLTGAVAKTVRAAKGAKSARVTFEVTATDDGGGIPVSCQPGSGSRFPLGKTIVVCAATDASGNTATAEFAVTVKRWR